MNRYLLAVIVLLACFGIGAFLNFEVTVNLFFGGNHSVDLGLIAVLVPFVILALVLFYFLARFALRSYQESSEKGL